MVGVDHTSGTDTKTETTDRPQASDNANQPPPDRPGTPGQPSRAESRAPTEAGTEKPEPENPEPAAPEGTPTRDVPRGPRAESWARARGELEPVEPEAPGEPGPRDAPSTDDQRADTQTEDASEPKAEQGTEPTEQPEPEQGPRAQSWARPTDTQDQPDDHPTQPSDQNTTGPEDQPPDHDDPQPPPEGEEPPNDTADRGGNAEDQPESPAPEEPDTDPYAGLPTRADLDPATAGELTRERGDPLTPINENQDLSEPDPERDSDWKRAMRGLDDNLEEVTKEFTKFNDNAQNILDHRPPSDYRPGVQHDNPYPGEAPTDTINGPSVGLGLVAIAMVGVALKHGAVSGLTKIFRRNNGDNG
ncbi:hypothetical protein [Actinomadura sp. 9N215]|uniref:hypothetical protein n=1 Tax=Actinomadura sp. 9N215 TaxID=3375150 RepID=UPI0037AF1837